MTSDTTTKSPPADTASKPAAVVITGLSGSGKSTALSVFEDLSFFTVDGLPARFAAPMADMIGGEIPGKYQGMALGMDLRQSGFTDEFTTALPELAKRGFAPYVLFFEAGNDVLLKRYATTRRPHHLEKEGLGLEQAVDMERHRLRRLRKSADMVVDTSDYSVHDLRRVILNKWKMLSSQTRTLKIHLITFGFKYGIPAEADMLFDLRFLPNPYFVPELKALSGLDAPVADFVLNHEPGRAFFAKLKDFMSFILRQFEQEGRYRLTAAVGCTGGRHRSVAIAEALAAVFKAEQYTFTLEHRHLELG
ncbi:MAG: RNase adapter RapZ [Desulfovibrio sp.]|jgi:UPF0042 nucleotide-binding protein|nr:RNase adapter RapZ [Desulfovibrio sp.]